MAGQFETSMWQWKEGERRVRESLPDERMAMDRVVERVLADIAYSVAPGAPWAWDARTTADAAFGRYVREASDYAGGRRLDQRPADSPQ
jgi:hypothetical protein